MRIIAGKWSGRILGDVPRNSLTHPMSEKIRGALFNILGDINDLQVLDAFAGSGLIGFEALSRGAGKVVFVDNSASAVATMRANAKKLLSDNVGEAVIDGHSVSAWHSKNAHQVFDVVIADPPFNKLQDPQTSLLQEHVKLGGWLVLSRPANAETLKLQALQYFKTYSYGDATLVFYQRKR